MRTLVAAALLVLAAPSLALADGASSSEILVYRRGKVLGFDEDAGAARNEVVIETWSCETGKVVKTEKLEAYFHLSEDGEVITPRGICDRCRAKFELEKKGTKFFFKKVKDAADPPKKEPEKPDEPPPEPPKPAPPKPDPARDQAALDELKKKVLAAANEIKKIDPRGIGSATRRRAICEDRGLQAAIAEFKDDEKAIAVIADTVEQSDLGITWRYYVLRSFGWQRHQRSEFPPAIIFYERCTKLIPEYASGHYQLALVHRERKEKEGEIVEMARALRAKPRLKYAKPLLDVLRLTKKTDKLDEGTLEQLRTGVADVKQRLEENPPDKDKIKKSVEDSVGKILDAKFPQSKSASPPPEPEGD